MKILMKKVHGYKKARMWNMAHFQPRRWHREQTTNANNRTSEAAQPIRQDQPAPSISPSLPQQTAECPHPSIPQSRIPNQQPETLNSEQPSPLLNPQARTSTPHTDPNLKSSQNPADACISGGKIENLNSSPPPSFP